MTWVLLALLVIIIALLILIISNQSVQYDVNAESHEAVMHSLEGEDERTYDMFVLLQGIHAVIVGPDSAPEEPTQKEETE